MARPRPVGRRWRSGAAPAAPAAAPARHGAAVSETIAVAARRVARPRRRLWRPRLVHPSICCALVWSGRAGQGAGVCPLPAAVPSPTQISWRALIAAAPVRRRPPDAADADR